MSSFDPMAAAVDWIDAYRAASFSIVDLYTDSATLDCGCGGRKIIAGRAALVEYWRRQFAEDPAGELKDLQPTGAGIAVYYGVRDGVVQAVLDFDSTGKIRQSRCGITVPRDRYNWDLQCPVCGAVGVAHVSEDAFPLKSDLRFKVDEVSEGFKVRKLGETAADTRIICVKCNVPA